MQAYEMDYMVESYQTRDVWKSEVHIYLIYNTKKIVSINNMQLFLHPGVTISLERVTYSVTEGGGTVEVCAVLLNCTLTRNAVVTLSTSDGSAVGKSLMMNCGLGSAMTSKIMWILA